ncbi:hypothetical protein [Sphingomonas bacterium]|uniref:hypothetical protein n=1 Tax=Sphingomonas bacterium TaxID=1895847 RepID=UPI001576647E|nr:hypothetical protein [Sphingomonas bacterium]
MAGYREEANDGHLARVVFGVMHAAIFCVSVVLLIGLIILIPSLPLAMGFWADSPRSNPQDFLNFLFVLKTLGIVAVCGVVGSAISSVLKIRLPVYVSAVVYAGWLIWAVARGVV